MADHTPPTIEKVLTNMWRIDRNGDREFSGGLESWAAAADEAAACTMFCPDVEEERVADEERSCYNCRYRRWTADSFVCKATFPR